MLKLVKPAARDKALFDRMAQLYIYDFSEINNWKIGSDGLFPTIKCFDDMWDDADRFPHLIMMASEPAGFAIVRRVGDHKFDMEQFFVLRKFRRTGVGRNAAQLLFQTFSGNWTVEQTNVNKAAQAFWRSIIAEYTNGAFVETQGTGPAQSFQS